MDDSDDHKDSDVVVVAAPAPKKSRKAAPAKGSLVDGGAAGPSPSVLAEMMRQQQIREAFEEYDTELLLAWLLDYEDGRKYLPQDKDTDRTAVLSALVTSGAQPPDDMEHMHEIWAQTHPDGSPPGRDPAWVAARAKRDRVAAAAAAAGHEDVGVSPVNLELRGLLGGTASLAHKGSPRVPTQQRTQPSDVGDDGDDWPACATCGEDAAQQALKRNGVFMCVCGLRGDLPINHAINVALREDMCKVAAAKEAGPKVPAGNMGQSPTDSNSSVTTAASSKRLTPLQQHLITLREEGPNNSVCAPGAKCDVKGAQALVREAHNALTFESPSKELVELIRSGRLASVAFAVPRLTHRADAHTDAAAGTLQVGADGTTSFTPKDPRVAPVKDMASFLSALVSTVLPALVDKPAAIANWCALSRSALAVHAECGGNWDAAARYLDMALRSAVDENKPFGAIVLPALLTATRAVAPCSGGGGIGPPQRQQRVRINEVCYAFNKGHCVKTAESCRFVHACQACGSPHAAVENSACAIMMQQGPRALSGRGGRGGRVGYRGRGGVGSVKSEPTGSRNTDSQA